MTLPDATAATRVAGGNCTRCGATLGMAVTTCPNCSATVSGGAQAEHVERLRERLQAAIGADYQLLELLGRGGMGIVFRAVESALDREVALKVLALDPLLNPEAFDRFERESKLAARLDHPNIVPIFAVGRRESVAFYTMRLVRGGNVEEQLIARKQFDVEHAVAILRDVAAALDFAHGRGVVHRDVKPANILTGETGHALVADFGIAKALGGSQGTTATGLIGSPAYMSPEQWRGEHVDGRADQYGLAVVAFEMLTGRRPFDSPNMQDLLRKHLTGEIPNASGLNSTLSPAVDAALRRALSKDPEQRFNSARGFVEALAGTRPTGEAARSTRVPRYVPPAAPPPRRGVGGVMTLAFLLLVFAGALGFALPPTRPLATRYAERAIEEIERFAGGRSPVTALEAAPMDSVPDEDTSASPGAERADADGPVPAGIDAPTDLPEAADGRSAEPARRPIAVDTTVYGAAPSPFRSASTQEQFGFLRVVVQGGVAPILLDGRTLDVSANPSGQVVRAPVGNHYVSVRGAGVLFQPSQVTVVVGAGDTVSVVFSVPDMEP